ncbi:MAG: hypothetical protein AAFN11_08200 [Chloroflexota bacterium]
MAHMRRKRKGSIGRSILSMIAIMFSVIVCSVVTFGAVDVACNNDINTWAPLYPDSELVDETAGGFVRARASGLTDQVYYSPDDASDVRKWFRDYRNELTEGRYNTANPDAALGPQIATIRRYVVEADDGNGALIIYDLECAYN